MATDLEDRTGTPEADNDRLNLGQQHSDDIFNELTSAEHQAKDGVSGDTGKSKQEDDKSKSSLSPKDLAAAESDDGALESVTQLGKGFSGADKAFAARAMGILTGGRIKRRTLMGGGVLGVGFVVAFLAFTVVSGPFEFIHIAHILEQNLTLGQDQSNTRLFNTMSEVNHISNDQAYKSRLSFLGNKYADVVDAKLESVGLTSNWSDTKFGKLFGLHKGFKVDRNYPEYKGKDLKQLQELPSFEGATLTEDNGQIFASTKGYLTSKGFIKTNLQAAGDSDIASSIGAHVAGKRYNWSWHPISNLDTKIATALDDWWEGRTKAIENNEPDLTTAAAPSKDANGKDNPTADSTAGADKAGADQVLSEAGTASTATSEGKVGALSSFQDSINTSAAGKAVGVAGFGIGLACLARGAAEEAPKIKEAKVIEPLMKLGMEMVSLGNEVEFGSGSGNAPSLSQLGKYSQLLNNPKDNTSWSSAQSVQALSGEPMTGPAPDDTLNHIASGSPFDAFKSSVLAPVCSAPVSAAITVVSFLGGPASAAASLVVGLAASPKLESSLAHWLAGSAISPVPRGAEAGYDWSYGTKLAANQLALPDGATELSSTQTAQLDAAQAATTKSVFDHQSLAYRLFNPDDPSSLISKVMDDQSPTVTQNVNNVATGFLNLGHTLATLPGRLFSSVVHADGTETYNYGLPTFGFSQAEMDDPSVQDPFANADHASDLLDTTCNVHPCGQDYITEALDCFGVILVQVPGQTADGTSYEMWDVQNDFSDNGTVESSPGSNLFPTTDTFSDQYKSYNCNAPTQGGAPFSKENWLSIRMFIFDTQVMKSEACDDGDSQSCADEGLNSDSTVDMITPNSKNHAVALGASRQPESGA